MKAATEYTFFVSACNGYTMECGEPSQAVTGTTEDGKSGPPSDVVAKCKFDNVSDMNYVEVQWTKPKLPNGVIEFYNVRNFIFFLLLFSIVIFLIFLKAIDYCSICSTHKKDGKKFED